MRRSLAALACAVFCSALMHAQARPYVPPTPFDIPTAELKSNSERQLTLADLDWFDQPQCDSAGNAYVHPAGNFSDGLVVRLSLTGDDVTRYQWHDKPREMPFMDYSVTPSGEVWMLGQTTEGLWVVGFGSNGHEGSRSRVDIAATFWPTRFAVLSDGSFLLSGFYAEGSPEDTLGTSFSGIFDRSGKLRRRLPDSTDRVVPREARMTPKEGSVIVGPDDNFYWLRPDKVQVISLLGELAREVPFSKPEPKARTVQLWLAGNRMAIQFLVPKAEHTFSVAFLVLDSMTGVPVGRYKPIAGLGSMLCFSGSSFLFEKNRQGRITAIKADLP